MAYLKELEAKLAELTDSLLSPPDSPASELFGDELDNVAWVDFTETRYVLEPSVPSPTPETPDLSAQELADILAIENAGGDTRDYETFYRTLRERIFRGIWNAHTPHATGPYTVVIFDLALGTITIRDTRGPLYAPDYVYNIPRITEAFMIRLPGDYAADFADSFFSIASASTSDAYFQRATFLDTVQLFFEGALDGELSFPPGLYGQISAGSFAQADPRIGTAWTTVHEVLMTRFGAGSEELDPAIVDAYTFRAPAPPPAYEFVTFERGDYNIGLRLVYRQEWRALGVQRGEVIRTIPLGPKQSEKVSTRIVRRSKVARTAESLSSSETSRETSDTTKDSAEVIDETARTMKWNLSQEGEGGFNAAVWHVGGKTDFDIGSEARNSSRDTSNHLSESVQKTASRLRQESKVVVSTEMEDTFESTSASEVNNPNDEIAMTLVFRKLQQQYEVVTRLAEIQDVAMIAERLPTPAEVGEEWVRKYDWILAKALLDDSHREALGSLSQAAPAPNFGVLLQDLKKAKDDTIGHLGAFAANSGTGNWSASRIDIATQAQENYRRTAEAQAVLLQQNYVLEAKRYRLYEHIRDNILYYCRAIWAQEDPQQRLLRYRQMGTVVPLEWIAYSLDGTEIVDALATGAAAVPVVFAPDVTGRNVLFADLINPAGPIGYYGNYAVYYIRTEFASPEIFSVLQHYKSPYVGTSASGDPILMEPREKELAIQNDPATMREVADDIKRDMIRFVPALRLLYRAARRSDVASDVVGQTAVEVLLANQPLLKGYYAEYLFRKERARQLVVDTNSLMVDILPGEGSALEGFKLAHRAVDIQKVLAEMKATLVENERREKRLAGEKPNLEDPDTERVIVYGGAPVPAIDL